VICLSDKAGQKYQLWARYGCVATIFFENFLYYYYSAHLDLQLPYSNLFFEEMKEPNKAFSERDVQIIRFICDGLTSKEIGDRLSLARKTIENDRLRILRAYNVKSSNELIRLSILDGLYKPRTNQEILDEIQEKEEASKLRRFSRYK
jgi:DNA-binding CsgD family transcriptional regulator